MPDAVTDDDTGGGGDDDVGSGGGNGSTASDGTRRRTWKCHYCAHTSCWTRSDVQNHIVTKHVGIKYVLTSDMAPWILPRVLMSFSFFDVPVLYVYMYCFCDVPTSVSFTCM